MTLWTILSFRQLLRSWGQNGLTDNVSAYRVSGSLAQNHTYCYPVTKTMCQYGTSIYEDKIVYACSHEPDTKILVTCTIWEGLRGGLRLMVIFEKYIYPYSWKMYDSIPQVVAFGFYHTFFVTTPVSSKIQDQWYSSQIIQVVFIFFVSSVPPHSAKVVVIRPRPLISANYWMNNIIFYTKK